MSELAIITVYVYSGFMGTEGMILQPLLRSPPCCPLSSRMNAQGTGQHHSLSCGTHVMLVWYCSG